jgi:hypothetical protein
MKIIARKGAIALIHYYLLYRTEKLLSWMNRFWFKFYHVFPVRFPPEAD